MEVELHPGALIQNFSAPVYLNRSALLNREVYIIVRSAVRRALQNTVAAYAKLIRVCVVHLCKDLPAVLRLVAVRALAFYYKVRQLAVQSPERGRSGILIGLAHRHQFSVAGLIPFVQHQVNSGQLILDVTVIELGLPLVGPELSDRQVDRPVVGKLQRVLLYIDLRQQVFLIQHHVVFRVVVQRITVRSRDLPQTVGDFIALVVIDRNIVECYKSGFRIGSLFFKLLILSAVQLLQHNHSPAQGFAGISALLDCLDGSYVQVVDHLNTADCHLFFGFLYLNRTIINALIVLIILRVSSMIAILQVCGGIDVSIRDSRFLHIVGSRLKPVSAAVRCNSPLS